MPSKHQVPGVARLQPLRDPASRGAAGGPRAGPTGLAAGDFNRDGRLDLAVTNLTGGTLAVLPGNGAGGFAARGT